MNRFTKAMSALAVGCMLQIGIAPRAGALMVRTLNGNNKCLDVRNGSFYNRSPLQTYTCNYTRAQQFWFPGDYSSQPPASSLSAYAGGIKWCVDMPYASDGSNTWIFQCWGGSNQKWELANSALRLTSETAYLNTWVLTPPPGNLQPVGTGPYYPWALARVTLTRNNELRLPDGRCLDVAYWGTADHTRVIAYSCHGGANQKWYPVAGKGIVGYGNQCLTASSETYSNLEMRPCMGLTGQKFVFWSAGIRGDYNKCLTTQVNPQDWQNVFVRTCDGSAEQQWVIDTYEW